MVRRKRGEELGYQCSAMQSQLAEVVGLFPNCHRINLEPRKCGRLYVRSEKLSACILQILIGDRDDWQLKDAVRESHISLYWILCEYYSGVIEMRVNEVASVKQNHFT